MYLTLNQTYEGFFIRYALNGSIADKEDGTRYGMAKLGPLKNSPVKQPSILNTPLQGKNFKFNLSGVL